MIPRYTINKKEIWFLTGWVLYLFSVILKMTILVDKSDSLQLILKVIRYVSYVDFSMAIVSKYRKKELIILVLLSLLLLTSAMNSKEKVILFYGLILFAAKDINARRFLKISLLIQGILLLIIVVFSQMGILEDCLFNRRAGFYRHGLGFTWTTAAPILFFFLQLIYFYIRKEKIRCIELLIIGLIDVYFFIMTDTKMAFAMSVAIFLFMFFQKLNKKRWKFINKFDSIFKFLPEVICGITLLSFRLYDSSVANWSRINSLLSSRLELGAAAIKNYGYSLFGKEIEWIGFNYKTNISIADGYNYVDSSFLLLALNYGVVFLIITLIIYSFIIYRATKRKDYYLIIVLITILVFSITEPRLMNFTFNPFPILLFTRRRKSI